MIELIVNNLVRRRSRTLLTSLGVGLGVATIVALLAVSDGLTRSSAGFIHLGKSDFTIFQSGVSDPTASLLPATLVAKIRRNPHVESVTPLLLIVGRIRREPSAIAFGAEPGGFFAQRLVFVAGRPAGPGQLALGDALASTMRARPGSTVVLAGHRLRVSGVYHSGISYEDQGAVLPLSAAQSIAGAANEVTTIAVNLRPTVSLAQGQRSILREVPHTYALTNVGEAARAGANSILISNATLVIVILALIIGAITVTNTMAMSVLERQGEIALLSTIGWSDTRVATLVIGEGIGVSVLGAAEGLVLGVLGSVVLVDVMGVGAYVSPAITAWGLGRGLLVGVLIGVLGGLYPAWRVTRMTPLRGLARAV